MKAKVFQTAEQVAEVIVDCISDPNPKLRYLTSPYAAELLILNQVLILRVVNCRVL
jgi:hypothetical protein